MIIRIFPGAPAKSDLEAPLESDAEFRLFRPAAAPSRGRFLPWCGSLLFHAAGISGMLLLNAGGWFEPAVEWRTNVAEPIRLQLRDPLYLPANPAALKQAEAKPARTPADSTPGHPTPSTQAANKPAPGRFRIPNRLELPPVHELSADAIPLLQPDFTKQPEILKNVVPPLAYWAPQTAAPKPEPRKFVAPGRKEPAPANFALDAPPSLSVPNRQPVAGELSIAMPQVTAAPALPTPNSSSNPVRIRDDSHKVQTAALDSQAGQPVNVLALGGEHTPAKNIEIPRGLRNLPPPAAEGGTAGPAAAESQTAGQQPAHQSATGQPAPAAATGQQSGTGQSASADKRSSSQGADPKRAREAENAGARAAAQKSANDSGSRPESSSSASNSKPATRTSPAGPAAVLEALNLNRPVPAEAAAPAVTRIQHPTNGKFDVVIMHSTASDDLPDIGGILSGNPIYTVYLAVGDEREWLMQYCLPSHNGTQNNPYQITIDDSGNLAPPYPISTVIPTGILGQSHAKHIVLRGILTAAGSFTELKAADANNPIARQVLPLLGQWRFRPASRDKVPVDVEVLLVIPPRS